MIQDSQVRTRLIPNDELQYDPFMNPPSLALAQKHKLAMSVGTEEISVGQSIERCPCCHHAVHKSPLPACCPDQHLSFLGVGHPLYYRLSKYFAFLIILVFISSGGALFLVQNLQCKVDCVYFFGIPVMKMDQLDENPELKSQWFNLSTCILVMVGVLCIKPKIQNNIEDFKSRMWCPSNYTVMLQNLPPISEEELNKWILDYVGVEPVKINITYDLTLFKEAYSRKQEIALKLNKLKIQAESLQLAVPYNKGKAGSVQKKIQELSLQLEKQNKILRQFNSQEVPPVQTGTAFVSFNEIKNCEDFVKQWGDSFTRSFLNCCFGYIRSPFPICHSKYVLVSMAPSPADVIWENLSFSFIRNIFFQVLAFLLMAMAILIAFKVQHYFVNMAFTLKMQRQKSGQYLIAFLSISMSGIVLVLNMLLRLLIQKFCQIQKYYSYSKYHSSFANSYLLMYFINTCFTVYIVHGNWLENSSQILIWDIHLIMLTNAFSEPFAKLLDPTMMLRYFQRWCIRRNPINPYTQQYVNSVWQGHPMSIADNYQYIARILLITIWFSYPAPLGVLISLLAMLMNYWVDKLYLVKVNKLPEQVNQTVASRILMVLELLPLVYMCGTLQYTYEFGQSTDIFQFLAKFLNYGIVFAVILLTMLGYALFKRREFSQPHERVTYQQAQYLFTCDYDSENPITRYQSEIEFLNKLLKTNKLDEQSSHKIQTMISKLQRKKSIEELEVTRSQIIDIRKQLATERLQWHKYNNSQPEEMLVLSKGSSNGSPQMSRSDKLP